MPGMLPREAFLSHSSLDQEFADELAEVLRAHGVPVWYSRTNIVGAQQWHDEIGAALGRCDWFIVLLSPASVQSMWVKRELIFALQQNQYQHRIVPVLLEPCEFDRLSWVLSSYQMVDFTQARSEAFGELLRLWGVAYRPSG